MPKHRFLFALALAGCAAQPERAEVSEAPSAALISGDGLTLEDAAIEDRYILRRGLGNSCSGVSAVGWTVSYLFEADGDGYRAPTFARYCVLEHDPSYTGTRADPSAFSAYGSASPDAAVVAAMGTPTETEVRASFVEQVRPFPNYSTPPTKTAWLTLIDSSPTAPAGDPDAYEVAGDYEHGQQLATLALRATCDGATTATSTPDCVVNIGTQLAIGWELATGGPVRSPAGGHFGTQADLASAIESAVLAWAEEPTAGPLVLNLSLGWHPEAGGDDLLTATPPVLAVADAIAAASCKDALVISSVGQVDSPVGTTDYSGPIYPAAWESLDAPSPTLCKALLGDWFTDADEARGASAAAYTPLIYGVSAVDVQRDTLASQRPGAISVHAAAGSHLATYNVALGANTTQISGTSAAAVVVSSAAAVVRSHYPVLDAHETMAVLRGAAAANGNTSLTPADVCNDPGGGCADTHYVTVCESLQYAASLGGGYPGAYSSPATCAAIADATPLEPTSLPWSSQVTIVDDEKSGTCAFSGNEWFTNDGITFDYACPADELYAATALPITLPQPPGNECPWCPAYQPNRVDLNTATNLADMRNLTIGVERQGDWTYFPLGARTGNHISVFVPTTFDANVTKITFSYSYAGQPQFMYVEPIYRTW